VKIWSTF